MSENETGIRTIDPYALLEQIRSIAGYKQSSNQSPTVGEMCDEIQEVLEIQDQHIEELEALDEINDELVEASQNEVPTPGVPATEYIEVRDITFKGEDDSAS